MSYCGETQSRKFIFLDIRAFFDYNERHSGCVWANAGPGPCPCFNIAYPESRRSGPRSFRHRSPECARPSPAPPARSWTGRREWPRRPAWGCRSDCPPRSKCSAPQCPAAGPGSAPCRPWYCPWRSAPAARRWRRWPHSALPNVPGCSAERMHNSTQL